jgi:hypothetical protein
MPKISIFILLLQLVIGIDIYSVSKIIFLDSEIIEDLTAFRTSAVTSILSINTYKYIIILSINQISKNILTQLLLLSSLMSLIIGAIVGLSQIRIKRLLAYASILNCGRNYQTPGRSYYLKYQAIIESLYADELIILVR